MSLVEGPPDLSNVSSWEFSLSLYSVYKIQFFLDTMITLSEVDDIPRLVSLPVKSGSDTGVRRIGSRLEDILRVSENLMFQDLTQY